jgi:hypothetical protein
VANDRSGLRHGVAAGRRLTSHPREHIVVAADIAAYDETRARMLVRAGTLDVGRCRRRLA